MQPDDFAGSEDAARQAWLRQLRTTGRATTARLLTLEVLEEAREHLTVAEVHEQLKRYEPDVNLSTVYRTMDRLLSLRLVHRLAAPGDARYGTLGREHHQAVCMNCGRVIELELAPVAQTLAEIGEAIGMRRLPSSTPRTSRAPHGPAAKAPAVRAAGGGGPCPDHRVG